ncbi:MAG: hypothetical protein IID45_09225 [Planctomycetes bacterium]|nr:hypothetical protein [Planctomycetota bacterium]
MDGVRGHRWGNVFAASLLLCSAGCVMEGPFSLRRVWFDYNTLNTPAFFYDKIHHQPPDSARVKQMRWMYGKTPIRENIHLSSLHHVTDSTMKPVFRHVEAAPPQPGPVPTPTAPVPGRERSKRTPAGSSLNRDDPKTEGPVAGKTGRTPLKTIPRTAAANRGWRFLTR